MTAIGHLMHLVDAESKIKQAGRTAAALSSPISAKGCRDGPLSEETECNDGFHEVHAHRERLNPDIGWKNSIVRAIVRSEYDHS